MPKRLKLKAGQFLRVRGAHLYRHALNSSRMYMGKRIFADRVVMRDGEFRFFVTRYDGAAVESHVAYRQVVRPGRRSYMRTYLLCMACKRQALVLYSANRHWYCRQCLGVEPPRIKEPRYWEEVPNNERRYRRLCKQYAANMMLTANLVAAHVLKSKEYFTAHPELVPPVIDILRQFGHTGQYHAHLAQWRQTCMAAARLYIEKHAPPLTPREERWLVERMEERMLKGLPILEEETCRLVTPLVTPLGMSSSPRSGIGCLSKRTTSEAGTTAPPATSQGESPAPPAGEVERAKS